MSAAASSSRPLARPPMAGGAPLSESVADEAAGWLTLLMSGHVTPQDRQRWQQWRMAHPDHERAWAHVEAVTQRLKVLGPQAGYQALSPYAGVSSPGRRNAARLLFWGGAVGVSGLLVSRSPAWQQQVADLRTGTGEQRNVTLDDGTHLVLDTASAVNVRFDGQRRVLRLVAGAVMVTTGHATRGAGGPADGRPFIVETAEGRIRALGTRFSVSQQDGRTGVAVVESAVEITPAAGLRPHVVEAGERASFTRSSVEDRTPLPGDGVAWARGQIVAADMRLGDFLGELGRYRPGLLRCAPEVAGLRFSGVFPLRDTDRILETLPNVLPVQVRLRTRYWVTVEAAG